MKIEQHELRTGPQRQIIDTGIFYARAFAAGEVQGKLVLWYEQCESIDEGIFQTHDTGGRYEIEVQVAKTGDSIKLLYCEPYHIGTVVTKGGEVYHVYAKTEKRGGIME